MGGLILIEGLDLAGKSTLVAQLLRYFASRGVAVRTSRNCLCPDNPVHELADRIRRDENRNPVESASLFLASHLWDVRHFAAPGQGVHIQDSCWMRSAAFDRSQSLSEMDVWWRDASGPSFDRILFLTASLDVRRQRYHSRADNDCGDHWVFARPRAFLDLEDTLRREVMRFPQAVELDTSLLSSDDVLERSLDLLGLRCGAPRIRAAAPVSPVAGFRARLACV